MNKINMKLFKDKTKLIIDFNNQNKKLAQQIINSINKEKMRLDRAALSSTLLFGIVDSLRLNCVEKCGILESVKYHMLSNRENKAEELSKNEMIKNFLNELRAKKR